MITSCYTWQRWQADNSNTSWEWGEPFGINQPSFLWHSLPNWWLPWTTVAWGNAVQLRLKVLDSSGGDQVGRRLVNTTFPHLIGGWLVEVSLTVQPLPAHTVIFSKRLRRPENPKKRKSRMTYVWYEYDVITSSLTGAIQAFILCTVANAHFVHLLPNLAESCICVDRTQIEFDQRKCTKHKLRW